MGILLDITAIRIIGDGPEETALATESRVSIPLRETVTLPLARCCRSWPTR